MKNKNVFATLLIVCTVFMNFTSCKNDENVTASATSLTATAGDEAQASTINDQLLSEVNTYVSAGAQLVKPLLVSTAIPYPIVTFSNSKTTIDFGTTGFTGRHGNILKGKLIVTLDIKTNIIGSSRTITYEGFTINGISVTGTNKITFGGWTLTAQNPYWTIEGDNTIMLLDKKTITWKANRRLEFTARTTNIWGENYVLTGSASGTNAEGKAYTITIKEKNPLTGSTLYPYITKGSVDVTIGQSTGVIDYGTGTQDNKATLTYAGVTYEFMMK